MFLGTIIMAVPWTTSQFLAAHGRPDVEGFCLFTRKSQQLRHLVPVELPSIHLYSTWWCEELCCENEPLRSALRWSPTPSRFSERKFREDGLTKISTRRSSSIWDGRTWLFQNFGGRILLAHKASNFRQGAIPDRQVPAGALPRADAAIATESRGENDRVEQFSPR